MYQDSEIKQALKTANNLIINENYFQFNNTIYEQEEGVPMGSPMSDILVELKLRKLEIIKMKLNRRIIIWLKYVDDVFAILEKNTDEIRILNELNTKD